MQSSTRRRIERAIGVTGLATAVLLAFGGLAQAEPEGSNVINACVSKKNGDVRIPSRGHCTNWEDSIRWNVKGPRGPQGPAGPAGLTGPARVIAVTEQIPAGDLDETIVADCPDGYTPTGGGAEVNTSNVTLIGTAPLVASGGVLVGWRASFTNPSAEAGRGTAYVVCYHSPS